MGRRMMHASFSKASFETHNGALKRAFLQSLVDFLSLRSGLSEMKVILQFRFLMQPLLLEAAFPPRAEG